MDSSTLLIFLRLGRIKIKHVKIQNFRGIDDLSLDFGSDNINIVISVKGVGKSSVIDCVRLLLSEYVNKLREVFRERKLQQSSDDSNYVVNPGNTSVSIGIGGIEIDQLNRSWMTWLATINAVWRFELQLLYFPIITDHL